jgi:hypothetical protein
MIRTASVCDSGKAFKRAIKERTIEKLEIERRYWELKEIPWSIVTEQNIFLQLPEKILNG